MKKRPTKKVEKTTERRNEIILKVAKKSELVRRNKQFSFFSTNYLRLCFVCLRKKSEK